MLTGMVDAKMDKMLSEIKAIKSIISKKIVWTKTIIINR
jgi:hypothetical protein